jgi:hypothetical protein
LIEDLHVTLVARNRYRGNPTPSISTPGKIEASAADPGEVFPRDHPIPDQKGLSTAAPDSKAIPAHLISGFKPESKHDAGDHDSQ